MRLKMGLPVYENLKGFASSRPPLVVFMVCMGLFAFVLLTLSYYVRVNEIRNPDISQDWRQFLEKFAQLEFCITGNNSEVVQSTTSPTTPSTTVKDPGKTTPSSVAPDGTTAVHDDGVRNYSVSMWLTITPTTDFLSIHHNITHVSGMIFGHDLGLTGAAADEQVNITAELPYEWNNTKCIVPYGCKQVVINTCVHFIAPSSVFPVSRSPPMCESLNETGLEYHARMTSRAKTTSTFTTFYCRSRPVIKVEYKFNPKLALWLSLHDRSVINLHLMHTSYFLFVMVITLFCYAIIRGRPLKNKLTQTQPEQEKLTSSSKV